MPLYEEYLPKLLPPPFGPKGRAFMAKVGTRMDAILRLFWDAVYAGFPDWAPDDALDVIGAELGLPRSPDEPQATYAARLREVWPTWEGDNTRITGKGGGAGSRRGILLALKALGVPIGSSGATLVSQGGSYYQLTAQSVLTRGTLMNCVNRTNLLGAVASRPGWTFEGRDNFYAEFGLVFPVSPGPLDFALLNQVVDRWRQAKELFVGTWVIHTGRLLGWPTKQDDGFQRALGPFGTEPVLGGNVVTFHPGPDAGRVGYYA